MQIKKLNVKFPALALISLTLMASPLFASAAELYFYPAEQILVPGETAVVEVRLNTEDELINAIEISGMIGDALEAKQVEASGSFMPVILEAPRLEENMFYFTGAVPNGFAGDGVIGRIIVKAKSIGEAQIKFVDARLFLNSADSEEISPVFKTANVRVISEPPDYVTISSKSHEADQWDSHSALYVAWDAKESVEYSYRLSKSFTDLPDNTPDVPVGDIKFDKLDDGIYYFTLCELHESAGGEKSCGTVSRLRAMIDLTAPVWISANVSDGTAETDSKKFISFVASDNISGINRYEISVDSSEFKSAESPHVLVSDDAEVVVIKAFDRAGNESAKIIELGSKTSDKAYLYILLLLSAVGIAGLILRKKA